MDAGRARIERLVALGELQEKAARKLIEALEYQDRLEALPPRGFWLRCFLILDFRTPRPPELHAADLLSGRIDEREFRRRERRAWLVLTPIAFSLWMTACMVAFHVFQKRRPPTLDEGRLIGGACLTGGALFGAGTAFVSGIASRRWIRLRRLLDSPGGSVDEMTRSKRQH